MSPEKGVCSLIKLDLANFLAKYSCPRWNRLRILRKLCRMGYHAMGQMWIWRRKWDTYLFIRLGPPKPSKKIRHAVEIEPYDSHNTYPWPYCDPRFATWEEDDSPEGYNLISDPAGFVIRRSTSYCAWKIYEATGRWPTNHGDSDKRRFDAKDWEEFLSMNYSRRVEVEDFMPYPEYCFIGIIPDQGEFGQVVHLECAYIQYQKGVRRADYYVSTYEDFRYKEYRLSEQEAHKITWMMTSRFHIPPQGWRKVKRTYHKLLQKVRQRFC